MQKYVNIYMHNCIYLYFSHLGRKYDKTGRLVQWWEKSSILKFKKVADCIRNQYSSYKLYGRHVSERIINFKDQKFTVLGMINAVYHDKPLLFIRAIRLSLSRLYDN